MPCEQLVPIDRRFVMVSLLSGNPRENGAFGPARGTRGQQQTMRPLREVCLLRKCGEFNPFIDRFFIKMNALTYSLCSRNIRNSYFLKHDSKVVKVFVTL